MIKLLAGGTSVGIRRGGRRSGRMSDDSTREGGFVVCEPLPRAQRRPEALTAQSQLPARYVGANDGERAAQRVTREMDGDREHLSTLWKVALKHNQSRSRRARASSRLSSARR